MQGRLHQTLAGTSWLLALLTLLLGGLAWHRSHLQSLAQHNLTCDHALLSRLMVLRNLHDRMALHARCYERTGQAADLQPFHTAATDLAANVSPLRRLAGHDQRQQELLTQLELTAHDCLTLADHVLHVGRGHDHTTARWLLASDGTRQLHARLDQLLIQAGGRAAAAVRHHAAAAASHASGTGWWILFGTLTAAGGIVLTGRRLTCLDQRLGEAETQLRSARQEMEQRVAERTAEINTVNVGLQAEIQERQRIEDALHRAHGELELRVDQRTHELAQANLELQREIAERRRIAEALKNSRALYHSLVENLPVHIWRTNLEGQYTFGNEHLCDCLGVSQEEFLGRTAHDFFQPDVAEKFLRDDRKVIESGDPLEDIEEVVTLQHRRSFQQVLKTPCYDEAGRMIGVQGIGWDVTERKEAEEEKQRILAQLEESHRHLVARNEEIQNFYHTLSHELKTPLTSAREFVSIVLEGIAGPLNDAQREYLNIARESCNQMRVCINDLLDATRLETGKLSLDRQPADLGALAQKVVSAQQPAAA
ncbi:MAG TPA: PAS domain-containing protein, partial [Methylomirabilota bacterium]|nr:PAS domain-containing protein [Methylomirabilota bacterium]